MTPDRSAQVPVDKITIDDVKHRAEAVKDLATLQAREAAEAVFEKNAGRTLLIMAGIAVVAASFAFYLGSKAACRELTEV